MKGRYDMIKKLISAVASVAIAVTTFASLAYAEKTYDIRLDSGVSYTDGVDNYGSQYFTVWCDDLAGGYMMAETVTIKVVSGKIGEDTANYEWDVVGGLSTQRGMYTPGRSKTYFQGTAYTKNVWTDDNGVQWIGVSWAGTAPAMTDDGMLFEFYVTPKTSEDLVLEIAGTNTITSSNSTGGDKSETFFAPEVAPQYVLAAGTSTITEKSNGGSVDADPVNDGEVFTDAANAQAVAFSATVGSDASGKTGRWYATIGGTAMKTKDAFVVPNLVGNAKYGLIYKGTETISNVSLKWE